MASYQPGVWGIDLGLCALKAIRLEYVDGAVRATAFDYIEHPKILSQPDADPDQLTREALEQFLSRNSLRGDMCVISVSGQSGLARFVKLPPVEERKIADIVKFEAKQQIPFPLDEVVWDYQRIGTPMVTDGLALETEIGLFAMKKDMVNRALSQFKEVNVEVHVIQMAPLALINYLAFDSLGKDPKTPGEEAEEEESKDCVVALDIGTDNSNLVITDGEKVIWQRPIPLGGSNFTKALIKDMKLTFAKAEHLKRNAVKSPDLRKILAALKSVLADFVGEVQRSLGYFTNTHRDANIKYMVGLGGAFRLPGLQKFLQEKLQLEVRKISKFNRLEGEDVIVSPQFQENILSFAVAYGLALQGLKRAKLQTNLLPYDVRVERLVRGKKPWAAVAAAAMLVAVAGLSFGKNLEKSTITGPENKKAMDSWKKVMDEVAAVNQSFKDAEDKFDQSKKSLSKIVVGIDERFNWQLMAQYINLALPQPDGSRLAKEGVQRFPIHQRFFNDNAVEAFKKLEARRTPTKADKQKVDPALNLKDDEFIKKHLIQINLEGFQAAYCDDVVNFFKNVVDAKSALRAMRPDEAMLVKEIGDPKLAEVPEDKKKKLPEKAWVCEIRGYTYHIEGETFIINTLIENLRYPEGANEKVFPNAFALRTGKPVPPALDKAVVEKEKDFKTKIQDNVSFLFLFKSETVENPEPGVFQHIKGSWLAELLKPAPAALVPANPAAPLVVDPNIIAQPLVPKITRDTWLPPAGTIAAEAFAGTGLGGGGGPGQPRFAPPPVPFPKVPQDFLNKKVALIEKQARREFVVLFLWAEPLPPDATVEAKKE
jgi:type IV pilus assembly protein PilM